MLSEISLFLNSMQGSVLGENSPKKLFFAQRSDLAGRIWHLVNAIGKTMILSCKWMLFLFFPRTTLPRPLFMAESLPWSADDLDAEIVPLLPFFVYLAVSFSSRLREPEIERGITRELFPLQFFYGSMCYMLPCLFHPFLVSKLWGFSKSPRKFLTMPRGGLDDSSFRPKNKVENQYVQARLAQP